MIEPELDRDALHQPLQRQIKLRPAEAANEARRHLVGQHHAVDHVDVGDVVAAGHRAVHAVERPGHRRAQERAVVLELIHLQPEDFAVLGHRGFDLGDAVRPGAGGEQMLGAVLDPFHRAAGDLRGERGQHHIGKHRELDAEAAAGVRRNAQPHLRARHAQRPRHHRMRAERPLEVRHAVVAVVGRIVRGDRDEAFHRREREPVEVHRQLDDLVGLLERALGVAVVKLADRNFVGLGLGVQDRRRPACTPRADRSPLRAAHIRSAPARRRPRRDSGSRPPPARPARRRSARDRPRATIDGSATSARPGTDRKSCLTSSPVMTAQTPSFASASAASIVTMSACGCGERMTWACSVPAGTGKIVGIAAASRQQRRVFLAKRHACRDAVTPNQPHAG